MHFKSIRTDNLVPIHRRFFGFLPSDVGPTTALAAKHTKSLAFIYARLHSMHVTSQLPPSGTTTVWQSKQMVLSQTSHHTISSVSVSQHQPPQK
jgi:hypothetical protein